MPPLEDLKSLTMTFRLKPTTKDGLKLICDRESRSYANSIEWLVKEYFSTRGLPWPPEIQEDPKPAKKIEKEGK